MTLHTTIRPSIEQRQKTMNAVVHAFTEIGRIEAAKFWAAAADSQERFEREAPEFAHLYDHWLREACQLTGVEYRV